MTTSHVQTLNFKRHVPLGLAACAITLFSQPTFATEPAVLTDDDIQVTLRYRIEHVDQDNVLENALASTLRTRVTATKYLRARWSALLEVDHVELIGNDNYNSTANAKVNYSVVADPRGTDINQAALRFKDENNGTEISLGRFRMNHLNQRFIGGVGWRQNEQTYDGARVQQQIGEELSLDVAAIHNVNRIFGPKGPQANQRGNFYSAVLNWQINDQQRLNIFNYDFDFQDWHAQSSRTYGADYHLNIPLAEHAPLALQVTVARQNDAHTNPQMYQHHYHRLSAQWRYNNKNVEFGTERLSGNGSTAFQTPFATLHAFQGFTDLFLTTPNDGVRDHFAKIAFPLVSAHITVSYHYFESDFNRRTYGKEWNIAATQTMSNGISLLFKFADYQAKTFAVDTRKAWFMLSYRL
ncbi:alginate export family protein [Aliidiomarina celeris]|uniref:alginate export family protein n=1 Tax=Aliidiomarina celeris TaxID=2249428 RepID=UPI000DEAB8CA|nr:alginate export family protein [Aliidiomarina celeris]